MPESAINFDLFKEREREWEAKVNITNNYLGVRIDGRAFHTYTKPAKKPFDEDLQVAMVAAMGAAYICLPHCLVAYTASDEISLIFENPTQIAENFPFGGRVQKLVSVLASAASAGFEAYHPVWGSHLAEFDARVFVLNDIQEVKDYMSWRRIDCMKNAISSAAVHLFGDKEVYGKDWKERLKMLEGTEFETIPDDFFWGLGLCTFTDKQPTVFIANQDNMDAAIDKEYDEIVRRYFSSSMDC